MWLEPCSQRGVHEAGPARGFAQTPSRDPLLDNSRPSACPYSYDSANQWRLVVHPPRAHQQQVESGSQPKAHLRPCCTWPFLADPPPPNFALSASGVILAFHILLGVGTPNPSIPDDFSGDSVIYITQSLAPSLRPLFVTNPTLGLAMSTLQMCVAEPLSHVPQLWQVRLQVRQGHPWHIYRAAPWSFHTPLVILWLHDLIV